MNQSLPRPDPIKQLPVVVLLLKTSCNCRCVMCDIWKDTQHSELPVEVITGLLPQLARLHTREISLSGGEPLMHTRIEEICRAVKSANISLSLTTTGLLLKKHAAWVSECIDRIYVSLDGPETIHNTIRNIPNAFGKIADGINAVRRNEISIKIGGRCTVHRQNFRHMRETVSAAEMLGMDNISFLAADVQPGNFGRQPGWKENNLALTEEELPELKTELNRLFNEKAGYFKKGFIVESREKLERRIYGYYHALAARSDYPPVQCNAPWGSTVIETDGRVRPCFFHKPYPGRVMDQTLIGILNSDEALDWRRTLNVGANRTCQTCVCSLSLAKLDSRQKHDSF
jgi:MoaA/NifB/PqqE/SkfB family radical SAM enzyme